MPLSQKRRNRHNGTMTHRQSLTLVALAFAAALVAPLYAQTSITTTTITQNSTQQTAGNATAAPDATSRKTSLVFSAGAGATYRAGTYNEEITNRGISPAAWIGLDFNAGFFGFTTKLSANTDGKYAPALADTKTGTLGNIYFMMDQGGLFSKLGPVTLKAGRFRHYDIVDTPYSLFVNSEGLSANIASIAYEDSHFFFETRYIELNYSSSMNTPGWPKTVFSGFPDRGANLHIYGIKLGEMRFGFQDASVYSNRVFDWEYFVNPLPQYFTQYFRGTGGRPWTTDYNDNYIMGAFWNWNKTGKFDLLAQVLVDDFSLFGIFGTTNNPWKAALSLGGKFETDIGQIGVYAAAATKYTFEPVQMTGSGTVAYNQITQAYGYTYYPETRFDGNWISPGTQYKAIGIENNMIGYKNGENNLAVEIDWKKNFAGYSLGSALEFRLAGSNSPANPYHDLVTQPQDGTAWLDDAVLEKRIILNIQAAKDFGPWNVFASITGGYAFDALELRAPIGTYSAADSYADKYIWFYVPVAGNNKAIFRLTLGATYHIDLLRGIK
jgi:hypothetical protein